MNTKYIDKYIDINGKINKRGFISKIFVRIFDVIKFIFDRLLAFVGIIVLLPLILIVSVAIKLDSKGPILFKQIRTGKNGKNFVMHKFRTMVADNDVRDFSVADKHTKVGKFLRKTSLDEIPQLFTIAIGKMSFIGPRPWITDYYDSMNETQRHRFDVRPGLTGLAQVNGRNNITIFEKINYDLEYIKNYSLIQDVKIVFLTIKAVFTGNGADAGKGTIQNELEDLKKSNKS